MTDTYAQRADQWAYGFGRPAATGRLRSTPEDFRVEELPGFTADGQGEHVLIQLRKRNTNTEWLARQLARLAGVRARDVSYAGLKDKNAVTTQWFSVHLPGRAEPDWGEIESEGVKLLAAVRHSRKLRRGALEGNRFTLIVRELKADADELSGRLAAVAARGVPNYFGEQRFGRDFGNLARASALFEGARERDRHKRGLYLSAARSFLFNEVLSRRVEEGNWDTLLPGECAMLAGSRSFFTVDEPDEQLRARLASGDIHPSGPLWGRGELPSGGAAAEIERSVLGEYPLFAEGLERAGLEQERRPLRLPLAGFDWHLQADCLELQFTLPAGAFATSVLRELVGSEGGA
jgi:tRNA pseudouridine13 synthase